MRIGIAGAGIAGLTLAWLIDGTHDSVVLEARDDIGGNLCSRRFVDAGGATRVIDLGVHGVPLEAFTLFQSLTRNLGLAEDDWITTPATYTIAQAGRELPLFRGPLTAPGGDKTAQSDPSTADARQAIAMLVREAADWIARDLDWAVPLRDVVEPWSLPATVKENVVYALPSSLWACDLPRASTLSARATAAVFASDAPAGTTPTTQTLREGMQDVARRLAARLDTADLRPGAALRHIRRVGDRLAMIDSRGDTHTVDTIVLAVPADAAAEALRDLPEADMARRALSAYRYADIAHGVHLDPCYLCPDPLHRSTTNITVDGAWAPSTVRRRFDDGGEAFVSRLDHRESLPRRLLARAGFRTLLPLPAMFAAQRRLRELQGHGDLYFAGHVMTQVPTQESAMVTAVDVARVLAPDNPRLAILTPPRKATP
ncbi:FAD-dependent oxidoreductase [Embleya sp. MST-111070]|uniref:FAD-dependent oxidoreductase n=1 Tax=Embleya sp. MST-111070 TaxID=3398231 RepID=UPI003F7327EE